MCPLTELQSNVMEAIICFALEEKQAFDNLKMNLSVSNAKV
jgi:hypothetical protein